MATVKYLGDSYTCDKALKGTDYIHLLDSDGCMIVAFDGVQDFSGFSISGGSWTTPTPEGECYLAVVKDDGSIGKGGHRCCDINAMGSWQLGTSGSTVLTDEGLYEFEVSSPEVSTIAVMVDWEGRSSISAFFHWENRDTQELSLGYFHVDQGGKVTLRRMRSNGEYTNLIQKFQYRKMAKASVVIPGGTPSSSSQFPVIENRYSLVAGEDFTLKVPATDIMPSYIEIYVEQDMGNDLPPTVRLFNTGAGDRITIPYEMGGTFSIIAKTCGSAFDIYARKPNGSTIYLDSMNMEYIYLDAPDSQGWSFDTEIIVKICCIDTMV